MLLGSWFTPPGFFFKINRNEDYPDSPIGALCLFPGSVFRQQAPKKSINNGKWKSSGK